MKRIFILLMTGIISLSSIACDLFEQPTVTVKGYSLKSLPDEWTYLDVDVKIHNNDWQDAEIADVTYTATIEGIKSRKMKYNLNKKMEGDRSIDTTMPLTIPTAGAAVLLKKLENGQSLNFKITGTFHVDDPVLSTFDLDLDTNGSARVKVGYENYFEQPTVTVNSFTVTGTTPGLLTTSVVLNADVTVTNNDSHSATIGEISYTVTIDGQTSEDAIYNTGFSLAYGESTTLTLTGITFTAVPNLTYAAWIAAGEVNYLANGTFDTTTDLGSGDTEFYLPLYVNGTVDLY